MHERVVCVRECVCVWFDDTEPNANHNIVLGVRVFCIVVYMVRIHSPIYVLISATTVSLSLSHVTIKYTHIVYAKKKLPYNIVDIDVTLLCPPSVLSAFSRTCISRV